MASGPYHVNPARGSVHAISVSTFKVECDYAGGSNLVYFGIAAPGSATSDGVWLIKKFSYDGANNLASVLYANGSIAFNQIWDNRATLSYS